MMPSGDEGFTNLKILQSFCRGDNPRQTNSVAVVDQHYLTLCDDRVMNEQVDRFSCDSIQFDNAPLGESQQIADLEYRPANLNRNGDRDILD